MFIDSKTYPKDNPETKGFAERNIRAMLDFGISGNYYFTDDLNLYGKFVYQDERNPLNLGNKDSSSIHRHNCNISVGVKYEL